MHGEDDDDLSFLYPLANKTSSLEVLGLDDNNLGGIDAAKNSWQPTSQQNSIRQMLSLEDTLLSGIIPNSKDKLQKNYWLLYVSVGTKSLEIHVVNRCCNHIMQVAARLAGFSRLISMRNY